MTATRPAIPDVTLADCLRVADALGYELRVELEPRVELGDEGDEDDAPVPFAPVDPAPSPTLSESAADALIVRLDSVETENARLREENASLRRTLDAIRAAVPR